MILQIILTVILVDKLRDAMCTMSTVSTNIIKDCIIWGESSAYLTFMGLRKEMLVLHLSENKPPGIDNLECKLLRITAKHISKPLCHIFNKCFECLPRYLERS